MNENGNSIILGMLMLLMVSGTSLYFIKIRMDRISQINQRHKLFLCTKHLNGITQKYSTQIQKTNKWLKYLAISKVITIVIPYFGILSKTTTKKAIQIIINLQKLYTVNYLKKVTLLKTQERCFFSLKIFQTPVQIEISKMKIKRNFHLQALLRSRPWRYNTFSSTEVFFNQLLSKGEVVSRLIKKARPYSSPWLY